MPSITTPASRTLKGPGRPILDEPARALLVAALRDVDYVVIFSEPQPKRCLHELRPDVHAKGTDYTADTVPERATAVASASASPSSATPKTTPPAPFSNRCARPRMSERRFLVVRLGSLGDIVHTFPAVAALRESFPRFRNHLAHSAALETLVASSGLASEIWITETRDLASLRQTIVEIRAANFDAAIDYQGLWKSARLPFLGGVPKRIGFSSKSVREFGVPFLYTDRVHAIQRTRCRPERGTLSARGCAKRRRGLYATVASPGR